MRVQLRMNYEINRQLQLDSGLSLADYAVDPSRLAACLDSARGSTPEFFAVRARDGRRFFCDVKTLDPETLLLRLSGGPDAESRTRVLYAALSRLDNIGDRDTEESEHTRSVRALESATRRAGYAPRSRGHYAYVGLEAVKVVALVVAGILLLGG